MGLSLDISPHFSIQSLTSNRRLLLFVCNSLVLQMVLGQDVAIVRFSPIYWALVLPALIIPFLFLRQILQVLLGPGILLLAFGICAGIFQLARGDVQSVLQLFLLIWITAWCAGEDIRLTTDDLVTIFAATLFLGLIVALFTDLNPWGLFPGYTSYDYGAWRVSFFPHIANSATFSFITLMFLTRDSGDLKKYGVLSVLCAYFIIFSFVRTVLIASAIYVSLHLIFSAMRTRTPRILFITALVVLTGSLLIELSIAPILEMMQHVPLVARFFLRSATNIDRSGIDQQLYRPWLWKEHISIFLSSPHLMGFGNFKLLDHVSHNLLPGLDAAGSESFPTRLLATYGLGALFFFTYLVAQLVRLARLKDAWACACFPAIIFVMMNWGSIFHPTNVFFVLFFLLIKGGQGALAYESDDADGRKADVRAHKVGQRPGARAPTAQCASETNLEQPRPLAPIERG